MLRYMWQKLLYSDLRTFDLDSTGLIVPREMILMSGSVNAGRDVKWEGYWRFYCGLSYLFVDKIKSISPRGLIYRA